MAGLLEDEGGEKRELTSGSFTLYFLTFVVMMSFFNFGFELGSTSAAILLFQNIVYMRLTSFWKELIIAGPILSATIFGLIGAWFSDKFGRKKCVMFSCFCFILGAIITSSAYCREVLFIGRLLTGCAIGFVGSSFSVYVAECSPSHLRGFLNGVSEPLFTAGMLIATVVSVAFSNDEHNGWRYIWGLQGVFNFVQFFTLLFLPESPRWFIKKSRKKEAKESLIRLRNSEDVEKEIWAIEESFKEEQSSIETSGGGNLLLRMLKTRSVRRALVVGCALRVFAEFSGARTIIYYSGIIIKMSGIGDVTTVIWNTVVINSISLTFAIVGVWLVDRVGRRILVIIGLFGMSLSTFCMGTVFLMATKYSPWVNTTDNPLNSTCSIYRNYVIGQFANEGKETTVPHPSQPVPSEKCLHVCPLALFVWVPFSSWLPNILLGSTPQTIPLTAPALYTGMSLSTFCMGTVFLMATKYSPWVNTTDNPLNSTCSIYSQCDDCIRDAVCGFCYEDIRDVVNGACLPVSDTSHLTSEVGACNSSLTLSKYSMKWDYEYCPVSFSWVAIIGLALYLMFYAPSMGPLPWTINAEIFPLWARSTGNGIGCMIGWACNFIVTVTFLSCIEAIHNYGVFYVMASVALIGSVFFFFFLPETKNKSLEEIEALFSSYKQSI